MNENVAAPMINTGVRPKVAVLREEGVNSQNEMTAAFYRAGFDAYRRRQQPERNDGRFLPRGL